jgi:hypothetical protein
MPAAKDHGVIGAVCQKQYRANDDPCGEENQCVKNELAHIASLARSFETFES